MVDPGFHFDGPRFFLEILVDPGLVDPGSEKLSFTLVGTGNRPVLFSLSGFPFNHLGYPKWFFRNLGTLSGFPPKRFVFS